MGRIQCLLMHYSILSLIMPKIIKFCNSARYKDEMIEAVKYFCTNMLQKQYETVQSGKTTKDYSATKALKHQIIKI